MSHAKRMRKEKMQRRICNRVFRVRDLRKMKRRGVRRRGPLWVLNIDGTVELWRDGRKTGVFYCDP